MYLVKSLVKSLRSAEGQEKTERQQKYDVLAGGGEGWGIRAVRVKYSAGV